MCAYLAIYIREVLPRSLRKEGCEPPGTHYQSAWCSISRPASSPAEQYNGYAIMLGRDAYP